MDDEMDAAIQEAVKAGEKEMARIMNQPIPIDWTDPTVWFAVTIGFCLCVLALAGTAKLLALMWRYEPPESPDALQGGPDARS